MEKTLEIKFLGAIGTVTGSCTAIRFSNESGAHIYLVDVGEYQGERKNDVCEQGRKWLRKNAKRVDGIFITHAHYDHVGYLPELVMEHGFSGRVYCSKATEELMKAILADSMRIKGVTKYTIDEVFNKIQIYYLDDFSRGRSYTLHDDFTVTALNSAHVLGSMEFSFAWKIDDIWETLIFSGDIGPNEEQLYTNILLRDFQYPFFTSETGKINIVLESTYGNRIKNKEDLYERRLEKLTEIITDAMANNKTVVFPAFALNRSQEILLDLYYLGEVRRIGLDYYLVEKQVCATKKLKNCFVKNDGNTVIEEYEEMKSEFIDFYKNRYPIQDIDWYDAVSDMPEDVINKIAELYRKYRPHTYPKRTFNVKSDSQLMTNINSIYNNHLLETLVKKKDGTLGYVYLSKPFFKKFNLSDLNEQEKIKQAKNIIDSALTRTQSVSNDPKKDKYKDNNLKKIDSVIGRFKIIVSSSGMCDEGAVIAYLKKYLPDENAAVVLTGYQACLTNGYHLQKMNEYSDNKKISVMLHNIDLRLSDVKCRIIDMSEYYTGHADQDMLFKYVTGNDERPNKLQQTKVFLQHGQDDARNALKERLETAPNVNVEIPTTLSWYNLNTGEQTLDEEHKQCSEPETDSQDDIKRLEIGDITILIPSRHLRKIKDMLETL